MRDYGVVHTSFWSSGAMCDASDDARLLALYLLTGQHANMIGCFRLPDGYVSEDLRWPLERVSKAFDELFRIGFATRETSSKWVFIHKFLAWNPLGNPNQGIGALRLFIQVPDKCSFKPDLARVLDEAISHLDKEKLKGCERVLEPFRNQEQEQEQEQKSESNAHEQPVDNFAGDPPNPTPEPEVKKFRMYPDWQPLAGFAERAENWGHHLGGIPPTDAEIRQFRDYWQPETAHKYHQQWEMALAESLERQRSGKPSAQQRRDINVTGPVDKKIPSGFRGNNPYRDPPGGES